MIQQIRVMAQFLLASILLWNGLNGLFSWLPWFEMSFDAMGVLKSIHDTAYIFPIVSAIQCMGGILFFMHRWIPFASLMIAPIIIIQLVFYVFMDPTNSYISFILLVLLGVILTPYLSKHPH
ncbi:MAG: hypothetical protein ACO3K7_06875 [Candidatus Marinamargulisbacteria bacterium]